MCNTAFIFESFGDSNPKTDIVCGDSSVNWSYYRKIPATATEKSSEARTSGTALYLYTPTNTHHSNIFCVSRRICRIRLQADAIWHVK